MIDALGTAVEEKSATSSSLILVSTIEKILVEDPLFKDSLELPFPLLAKDEHMTEVDIPGISDLEQIIISIQKAY